MPRPRTSAAIATIDLVYASVAPRRRFPGPHIGFVHLDRPPRRSRPGLTVANLCSQAHRITAAKNALRPSALTPCFWDTYHIAWNQRRNFECPRRSSPPSPILTLTPVASQLTPRRRPGVGSAARRASKTFRPTNTPKKLRTRRLREPRVEFSLPPTFHKDSQARRRQTARRYPRGDQRMPVARAGTPASAPWPASCPM